MAGTHTFSVPPNDATLFCSSSICGLSVLNTALQASSPVQLPIHSPPHPPSRSTMGLFVTVGVLFWDIGLVFLNLITYPFRPKPGAILRKGLPGYGGKWPEYSPPKKGDSRSSCPALNAMANHGMWSVTFSVSLPQPCND